MTEPYVPVPDPEPNSNWDPHPERCSENDCLVILQSRGGGYGWCPEHGVVKARRLESQNFEIDE